MISAAMCSLASFCISGVRFSAMFMGRPRFGTGSGQVIFGSSTRGEGGGGSPWPWKCTSQVRRDTPPTPPDKKSGARRENKNKNKTKNLHHKNKSSKNISKPKAPE